MPASGSSRRAAALLVTALALGAVAPARAGPRPGFEVSFLETRVDGAVTSSGDVTSTYQPSFAVGGGLEWPLGRRFSLNSGLRFAVVSDRLDYAFDLGGQPATDRARTWLDQIGVPLRIRFHPGATRGWFLEAAGEASYLVKATEQHEPGGALASPSRARPAAIIFEDPRARRDVTDLFHRWDFSLGAAVGREFALGAHRGSLALRYDHGLTDVTKSELVDRHARVFELAGGVTW